MKISDLCFSKFTCLGIGVLFFLFPELLLSAEQQEFRVSGVVLSVDDLPLSGVNVIIKGTAEGTVTDYHGNFSITVPSDSTILYFSHFGYRVKEITISKPQTLTIRLSKDGIATAIKKTQNNIRIYNASRWDVYHDLMEKAHEDMKNQVKPDWDRFMDLMEKAHEDMKNQVK